MKRAGYFAFVAVAPLAAWCADISADPAFDRYRSIIDRMPFGEPPAGFDPTLAPGSAAAAAATAAAAEGGMTEEQRTEEEQRLASSVRVSVLNVTPAGRTMVGFTDSSAKPPEHYYLPVGGERDGWSVKAADPATEKITLAKGEVEVTLKLGEGSTGDGKGGGKKDAARGAPQPIRRGGLIGGRLAGGPTGGSMGGRAPQVASAGGTAAAPSGALARLRERRARQAQEQQAEAARRAAAMAEEKAENERREAEAKAAAEQAAAEREQQRAALQQIQEELRRQREERQRTEQQEQEGESE